MRAAPSFVSSAELERVRGLPPGRRVTVSREGDAVPAGFAHTRVGVPWTSRTVYRECRARDPLVLAVFDDRVVVRHERFHPTSHPLRHLLFDRFAVVAVFVVAWVLASRRRGNDPRR